MTFETYWKRLVAANPKLEGDGKMALSSASFKKQIAKAFAAGDSTKAAADFAKVGGKQGPFEGMFDPFGGIFGERP